MSDKHGFLELVGKLKKIYGEFDPDSKKFKKAPNSEISRELGYSDAQFSRLINEHATEGEYKRANQNVDRILDLIAYKIKFDKVNIDPKNALASPRKRFLYFLLGLFLGGFLIYVATSSNSEDHKPLSRYDMLTWTFESNFLNPYTGLRDLPSNCDYIGYKYQGRWELKNEYKLPFLRENSGFHYLAKSVVAYIRCSPSNNPEGKLLKGYEYQEHEIWYDILERPIREFINEDGIPMETYESIDFKKDHNFVKIGTIHSFYTNDFIIDSTHVERHGQDIGRDLEFVPVDVLAKQINNNALLEKIRRETTLLIQDPLRDFSQPSECYEAPVPSSDFHSISNGDEMTFYCQMTTAGRFPIHYKKTYVLKDQFIKDKCVSSSE